MGAFWEYLILQRNLEVLEYRRNNHGSSWSPGRSYLLHLISILLQSHCETSSDLTKCVFSSHSFNCCQSQMKVPVSDIPSMKVGGSGNQLLGGSPPSLPSWLDLVMSSRRPPQRFEWSTPTDTWQPEQYTVGHSQLRHQTSVAPEDSPKVNCKVAKPAGEAKCFSHPPNPP